MILHNFLGMNFKNRNKIKAEFSMASMTDIVFLLLIFFMLTSTLVTTNALELLLPKAGAKTEKNQIISVSITKDLEYYINKDRVSLGEIEPKLKYLLKNEKNPSITIRTDRNVPVQYVVDIMDIARRNKYKAVLATQAK